MKLFGADVVALIASIVIDYFKIGVAPPAFACHVNIYFKCLLTCT